LRRQTSAVYLAALAGCCSAWQLLGYAEVADVGYILSFAAVGLALLTAYRFTLLERLRVGGLAATAFACANALLSLSVVGGALLALARLGVGRPDAQGELLGMLAALVVAGLAAAVLVNHAGWRRWYVVTALGHAALTVLTFAVLSELTAWQKLEVIGL